MEWKTNSFFLEWNEKGHGIKYLANRTFFCKNKKETILKSFCSNKNYNKSHFISIFKKPLPNFSKDNIAKQGLNVFVLNKVFFLVFVQIVK